MATHKHRVFSLLAVVLTALVLFVFMEATAYFVFIMRAKNFYLPLNLHLVNNPETIQKFSLFYSKECGWEPKYESNPFGYRGRAKDNSQAILAVFGDSFTEGYPEIEKSWPYLLEQKFQRPVLNFGVGGYGTDQALWRFEKYYLGKLETPYVALVIMPADITRIINCYRGFFRRRRAIKATKPMYYKEPNGTITLIRNPLQSPQELTRLADDNFLKKMGKMDYWYNYYERYGLNKRIHFPYSYYLIRALPFYFRRFYETKVLNVADYKILYKDTTATDLLRFIVQRFATEAKEAGSTPLIVFLPSWTDMVDYLETGTTVYHEFFQRLREDSYLSYDALDYFAPYLREGKSVGDFFRSRSNGHYNPVGEKVVSDGFYTTLLQLESRSTNR